MTSTLVVRLVLGTAAGVVAAAVMNYPMLRQTDGYVPAYTAASVLARKPSGTVSFGQAATVHHVAGGLAGVLYALLTVAVGGVVTAGPRLAGESLGGHLLAAAGVVAFLVVVFNYLVLPVAGEVAPDRAVAVRRAWLRSALVFGLALSVTGPLLAVLVA
jgi:hypothetical protein